MKWFKKYKVEEIEYTDIMYVILKECSENPFVVKETFCNDKNINISSAAFINLSNNGFIKDHSNVLEVTQQGFTTYLAIRSQKESAELSRKAISYTKWAFFLSALSFIVSIIVIFINN